MLTFVTYYVKPPPQELEQLKGIYRLLNRNDYDPTSNPDEIISLMFASVKKFHPDARLCLLTDGHSQFKLDPSIEIIRYPRLSNQLDMEVLRALIYYLKNVKKEVNTIFLEWDQLVQQEVSHIFLRKTDLYLVYRRIRPLPFDDSFIGMGTGDFNKIIDFFEIILREYENLETNKFRYWLGKSMIFSTLFFERMKKAGSHKKPILAFKIKKLTITILNAKKYSNKLRHEEIDEYQPDAYILHFSNKKSRRLKEYWEKFLKDR
jgi:hypothetical protein